MLQTYPFAPIVAQYERLMHLLLESLLSNSCKYVAVLLLLGYDLTTSLGSLRRRRQ
jgi:hypothetical protein